MNSMRLGCQPSVYGTNHVDTCLHAVVLDSRVIQKDSGGLCERQLLLK